MTSTSFVRLTTLACIAALAACNHHGDNHSDSFVAKALVADLPPSATEPAADHVDADLQNPWGIAVNPNGFAWVADNGTSRVTLYDGNGVKQNLIVTLPQAASGDDASPTGIVYNPTADFVLTQGPDSRPALFIFAGEGGTLSAWSEGSGTSGTVAARTVFDGSGGGAVYKGLALANNGGANLLYATDFHNNRVDVFDKNFTPVTTLAGNFHDAAVPAGFAPFGIQAIGGKLYVSFAKQKLPDAHDEEDGAGLGYVSIFNADGSLSKSLVAAGALNAPWGLVMAPGNFGKFSGDLLVGNFGDGVINAYDPATGAFQGSLQRNDHSQIVAPGLWGLAFGNGINNQPTDVLYFAAGINDEANGLYGSIATSSASGAGGTTGYGG